MTYFRSVFDSQDRMHSSRGGTARWDYLDPEDPGFRIEIDEPVGGPAVIRVRGDLDVVTAPVLEACLAEAVLTGHSVVVDLLYVPFTGCAGLAALDDAANRLSEQRCRLTVAAPAGLHATMERIGLGAAAGCFDTVAKAFSAALEHSGAPAGGAPMLPLLDRPRSLHCSLTPVTPTAGIDRKGTAR
ncbi:STAS domain-containing protein [Rhodococcus koreensis]|uniref:STAS domain-containing protein n=1 Tax=Rhodococcus koreensis TaxID=99653 RepID=UPI0036D8E2E1